MQQQVKMNADENQIVIYQPNKTVRLDVRLENETVGLTQEQLCALYGVVKSNVSYHLKNIFGTNELDYGATVQKIRTVRPQGELRRREGGNVFWLGTRTPAAITILVKGGKEAK